MTLWEQLFMSQPPSCTGESGSDPVRSHTLLTEWGFCFLTFPIFYPPGQAAVSFWSWTCLKAQHNWAGTSHMGGGKAGVFLHSPVLPSCSDPPHILGGVLPHCGAKETTHPPPLQARAAQESPSAHSALCNSEGSFNTRQAPPGEAFSTFPHGAECWEKWVVSWALRKSTATANHRGRPAATQPPQTLTLFLQSNISGNICSTCWIE